MKTPAQRQGIVDGKQYRIVGPQAGYDAIAVSGGTKVGDIVELRKDDGTDLPFFFRVLSNGDRDQCVINIRETKIVDVDAPEVEPAPLKNYIIDVTDVETTVKVGKLLSADQIKRILDIVGE
jgi:hypothetical protein